MGALVSTWGKKKKENEHFGLSSAICCGRALGWESPRSEAVCAVCLYVV